MSPVALSALPCPAAGCPCPACVAEVAVLPLATGRLAVALWVSEPLPALIREATPEPPRPKGRGAARRPRPEIPRSHPMPATPTAPSRVRPPAFLVEALLPGRVTAAWAAEVLRVGPGGIPAIASGRAGLPASAWKRMPRELGDALKGVGGWRRGGPARGGARAPRGPGDRGELT